MLLRYTPFLVAGSSASRLTADPMSKRISGRNKTRDRLIAAAYTASKNAFAQYSKFEVGAALLTTKGEVFVGCNVENASYGMTNCAERTAIFSAVSKLGKKWKIRAIAVVNRRHKVCQPCGACRQVIYQFGPKATVFFKGSAGWKKLPITKLLPEGFRLK
jgi:cytidine deaminase